MIEFMDATIREAYGNYHQVKTLMEEEGPKKWMVESAVIVITEVATSQSNIHFWEDGTARLMETTHLMMASTAENPNPDDDLRELSEWCTANGWKKLTIDTKMLENPQHFEFWMRLYYAGVIDSEVLKNHDDREIQRMKDACDQEKGEENEY